MKLDLYEIAEVLAAKNDVSQFENVTFRNAEFDSRLIEAGDLFIPLKGARDGHDFITTAFAQGAAATLSERPIAEGPYVLVDDVLAAFQALAQYYLATKPIRPKATIIMKSVCPTRCSTCRTTQKSWFWKWDRTT